MTDSSEKKPSLLTTYGKTIEISVTNTDSLFMRRFCENPEGNPVLMVHGAIEDSHIFYSESGRGLAPFLAKQGLDVYVADFRGHGGSRPAISRESRYGQYEMICQDFPSMMQAIHRERGNIPVSVIAHSWGGVIVSSSLARFPDIRDSVSSLVYFGSKRVVRARNIQKFLKIDLMWKLENIITINIKEKIMSSHKNHEHLTKIKDAVIEKRGFLPDYLENQDTYFKPLPPEKKSFTTRLKSIFCQYRHHISNFEL